jgi:hypothetical protein
MTIEQSKSLTVHHRLRPPPGRVLWFERLFYTSAFLSVIGIALEWAKGMSIVAFAVMYVLLCSQVALIWLASRRRKNWARWLLLAYFLVWVISGVISAGLESRSPNWEPVAIPAQVVTLARILLEDIGLILMFTGSSRRWFHPRHDHRDPNSPW